MNFSEFFENKTILVCGGTGSIGSEIVSQILKYNPLTIRILSNSENELWETRLRFKESIDKLRFLLGDIRDFERVKRASEDVDYIFNAAAIKHVPFSEYNPMEAVNVNIHGLENIIEAAFANNKPDLLRSSGAKLDISPQLDEIQKFSTYTHSIPELNHYKFKKLAVVGTPCQLYTIRCMQDLGVTPSENVEICLGLFCYENFFFDKSQIKKFEKDFNIKFSDIEKINIKEDVIFKLKSEGAGEKIIHIPFNHLNNYMRFACNACDDFTNIYADISFGGLGSPDKYTTVIVRTEKGKKVMAQVISDGVVSCLEIDSSKKNKMIELMSQFSQSKVNRKEDFMKDLV